MATVIDAFVVTLGLDPSGWKKGQRDTRDEIKRTKDDALKSGKDIEAGGKSAAQFIGSLKAQVLGLFAAFTAGAGLTAFARDTVTTNAATGRLAKNLGVATEELSAWQGVMRKVGGTNADAEQSLQSLVTAFQQIQLTGQSPLIPYLQLLGVSLNDLKDPTATLLKLSDAFAGMDPQRAQALGAGMGLSPSMINTLQQGRIATEALLLEQLRLGVITKEDAAQAQRAQATLSALADSSATLGRDLLTAALPALELLGRGLTAVATWAQDHAGVVTGAFYALVGAAIALGVALAAPIAPFIAAAAAIAAVGAAIGFLIEDFRSFQDGGPSSVDWRPFLTGIEAVQTAVGALGEAFGEVGQALVDAYNAVPPEVWAQLAAFFAAFGNLLLGLVVGAIDNLAGGLRIVADIINLVVSLLRGDWSQAWKDAGKLGEDVLKNITRGWENAKKAVVDFWNAVRGKGEPLPERPKPRVDAPAETYAGGRPKNFETFQEVQAYFQRQGWTKPQARGIAAGVIAESGGNHRAENPTSGAYGLGQWMRPRAANFERVMGRPLKGSSREDQLKFINWELRHDPHENRVAGKQLAVAQTDRDALDIYVKKFMRPNVQNGEVAGDMSRGQRMLNAPEVVKPKSAAPGTPKPPQANMAAIKNTFRVQEAQTALAAKPVTTGAAVAVAAAPAPRPPVANDNRSTSATHIGSITVHTQAKDANGIARDLGKAIDQRATATQANTGLS